MRRLAAEREWLPEDTQKLHTLEIEGWDALDFDSKMASGAIALEPWSGSGTDASNGSSTASSIWLDV